MVALLHSFFARKNMKRVKVYYICDKTACRECGEYCKHTADVTHSLNYKSRPTRDEKREKFYRQGDSIFERE